MTRLEITNCQFATDFSERSDTQGLKKVTEFLLAGNDLEIIYKTSLKKKIDVTASPARDGGKSLGRYMGDEDHLSKHNDQRLYSINTNSSCHLCCTLIFFDNCVLSLLN